ncbi:MAG: PAS domain S-box protein [Deltaproteobacteria bacterium]|nr:PAS domain S-box protein [Deltaproteobacteria bacterium]
MLEKPSYEELERRVQKLEKDALRHDRGEGQMLDIEKRFQGFMDSTTDGFFLWDSDFNLTAINDSAAKMFSYEVEKEDLVGKNILEIDPEFEETGRYNQYLDVIESGEPLFLSDVVPNTKFGARYLNVRVFKVDEGIGMIVEDVTDRRQAEEALKRSLEYSQLHSDLANTFIELPPSKFGSAIQHSLKRTVEFFGVDRGTLVYWPEGETSSREIYSWHRKGIKQYRLPVPSEKLSYLAETIRKGEIFSFSDINELSTEAEKDYFLNEGTKSTIIIPMMIEGNVLGALIFSSFRTTKTWPHDLVQRLRLMGQTFTYSLERKHAEKVLRESEEKYRNLVELSPDPIIIIQDDHYRFINSAFTTLLGYTQKDVDNGLSFYEVVQDHDKETVSRRYQDRISEKPVGKKFTINLISKEGKIKSFESSGIKINYDGRPAFMSIARDISERKQAEAALRKAHDELEKRVEERTAALSKLNELLNTEIDERKVVENALRESEERYKLLFENAGALIQVFDKNGICLMMNGTGASYYEGAPNDFIGKSFHEFHLEDADEYLERIHNIVNSGEGSVHDELVKFPSGKGRWILSNTQPIRDTNGDIFAVQIISQDITERRRAEEALQYSEKRYRLIAENVSDVIWTLDMNMRLTYLSPSSEKLRGFSVDEAMNHTWKDTLTHDSLKVAGDTFKKAVEETNVEDQEAFNESYVLELEMKCKDGSTVWTEIHATFLRNSEGRLSGVIGITRNISERKRAEEQLRESEERLSLALDATQDGLWDWRVPEDEVIFSPRLKELLGYEVNERIPNSMDYWTSRIHPDHHNSTIHHVEEHLEKKASFNFDFLYTFKNGEYRWVNSRSIVLYDEKSKPYRVVGSVRDINKMKETEDLIRNLTQSLITSQESERQLISRELHDTVAQDLSSSRITCEMLLKYKSLTPGARKQISEVSGNLHKTLKSVRDISYELRPPGLEELGLVRTLYQLCNDFSEKTGVPVDFQSAGIDNLNLNYNTKINLYRLLQEGLNNVRKHADAGNIIVRLISSFPHIILRLEDNGKGFDLKERLAKASSEKRMGLRSMKERSRLLHGSMDIESSPGKGTKVIIKIPYGDENIGAGKNQIDH